jgi:hypothetical protein
MKKMFLAAAAAIAMIASASAQDAAPNATSFECVVTNVSPPDKDADPGYKVNISIDRQGNFLSVVHTTRSGAVYDRVDQYTHLETGMLDNTNAPAWHGTLKKNPVQSISGVFIVEKNKMHYDELIFGKDKSKIKGLIQSTCHQEQA